MFLNKRLYIVIIGVIVCFVAGFIHPTIFVLAKTLLIIVVCLCSYEFVRLFFGQKRISCTRECSDRFSNGDDNEIKLHLSNKYPFSVRLNIIDEVPDVLQIRDLSFSIKMEKQTDKVLSYTIKPVKRGIYKFGLVNIFVSTPIGFISRRIKTGSPCKVKVYPSYIRLKQYELIASSNKLIIQGSKRIKKIGQQLEPEQIKDYVKGDDYRTINWKATARRSKLMVNVSRDERGQNVYCLIDKGRTMQTAFQGMTLLDYSINASLALSYIAMLKSDKAGLFTFERTPDTFIPASRNPMQMQHILEALYSQRTQFNENDYQALYSEVNKNIRNRSLLLIFTNFDSAQAMQRQLAYLSLLAKKHTVLVIFFEDMELKAHAQMNPNTKDEIYESVIAEKFEYEKIRIIQSLKQRNILSLLTQPDKLSVDIINKYLDIKARNI